MNKIKHLFKKLLYKVFAKEKIKSPNIEQQNNHGLYEDGSYVPDWIYDGHYDCGDK